MVSPQQVDGRIAQLRAQARQEQSEKVQDGGKQGWLPPEEYDDIEYTAMEDDLRELTRGPQHEWLGDAHGKAEKLWNEKAKHPEAERRDEEMRKLEEAGAFEGIEKFSNYLQSHVKSRILNESIEGGEISLEEVLLEATERGCRELAEEAAKCLEARGHQVGKEDTPMSAWIGPPTWHREDGYGVGRFQFQCEGQHYDWEYVDYKDVVRAPAELATALGLESDSKEERQCLLLHPAAGYLMWSAGWRSDRKPSYKEVEETARKFRTTIWEQAAEAVGELGDPAPWIGSKESEVRDFAHDALRPHHDKDYRLYHAFCIDELQDYTLQFWRVNVQGQYQVDHIVGTKPGAEEKIIPFLIHGGHIRLLVPPEPGDALKLATAITLSGKADKEWTAVGWRELLAAEDPAAPLVPGKRSRCTRCADLVSKEKVGRCSKEIPWSFQEHPTEIQERIIQGGAVPLSHRPSFAFGIVCQEVFAGGGNWSKAMKDAGLHVREPVELYEDPMKQKGPRPHHDLKNPTVRRALLDEVKAMPGPDSPNVYEFGTPCTSYCDYALLNGGTRTFQEPQGDPQQRTAVEEDGNLFCEWTCEMCLAAYNNDKEFVVESSMPSGRYPKLWDQPAIQDLQRKTGALIVPTHLCEWGLAPSDEPEKRYKKGQWNLVSPGLYAYALLLARRCQGRHHHVQLKGSAPSSSYPRTREAQAYARRLCQGWAIVVQAAYSGWGPHASTQATTATTGGRRPDRCSTEGLRWQARSY